MNGRERSEEVGCWILDVGYWMSEGGVKGVRSSKIEGQKSEVCMSLIFFSHNV